MFMKNLCFYIVLCAFHFFFAPINAVKYGDFVLTESRLYDSLAARNISNVFIKGDAFGISLTSIGDLDGNGFDELAVGAYGEDDKVSDSGAVYILFMGRNANILTAQKISNSEGNLGNILSACNFGSSVQGIGDLNGDGVYDLAVGAEVYSYDGDYPGAIFILFLTRNGTVNTYSLIIAGKDFPETETISSKFGASISLWNSTTLVVGSSGAFTTGVIHLIHLNKNGSLVSEKAIFPTKFSSFTASDLLNSNFGASLAIIDDLDGNGVNELAVGSPKFLSSSSVRGGLFILFLHANFTVSTYTVISQGYGDSPYIYPYSQFGYGVENLEDYDGDGISEISVTAPANDIDNSGLGFLYVLFLRSDGTMRTYKSFEDPEYSTCKFGLRNVVNVGDLTNDGVIDLLVSSSCPSVNAEGGKFWLLSVAFNRTYESDDSASSETTVFLGLSWTFLIIIGAVVIIGSLLTGCCVFVLLTKRSLEDIVEMLEYFFCCYCCRSNAPRRRRRRRRRSRQTNRSNIFLQDRNKKKEWDPSQPQIIDFSIIQEICGGFSEANKLSSNLDGKKKMYHGIYKRLPVVIKVIEDHQLLLRDNFELELVGLFAMRHRNVIPLLAMCLQPNHPLCLLSPLLPNGSLASIIEKKKSRKKLTADIRLQIAIDAFRGLVFLHSPIESKLETLHRNIKASNLLLDANFNSRWSDVGLTVNSDAFNLTTLGYEAPEFKNDHVYTIYTDMFAAGVILLQLLTGQPAYDPSWDSRSLVDFCIEHAKNTKGSPKKMTSKLLDTRIEWDEDIGCALFIEAMSCIVTIPTERKTSKQVLTALEEVAKKKGIKSVNIQSPESVAIDPENADEAKCQICFAQPTETRFYPCFHSVVCYQCAQELLDRNGMCPHCRTKIDTVELGFFVEPYSPPLPGWKKFNVALAESV